MTNEAKFKIGDKVKILYTSTLFLKQTIGTVGRIVKDTNDGTFLVEVSETIGGEKQWWYSQDQLEMAETEAKERPKRNRSFKMSNKQKLDILRTTKGKFFTVLFTKQDGTERKMNCRLGVAKGLKGGENNHKGHEEYVTVYDMVNKGYRAINLETLKSIKMAGATITFD